MRALFLRKRCRWLGRGTDGYSLSFSQPDILYEFLFLGVSYLKFLAASVEQSTVISWIELSLQCLINEVLLDCAFDDYQESPSLKVKWVR